MKFYICEPSFLLPLLLLLVSQLHLWGSPFGVRFLSMWPFFNPTTEEVTFRLRGWCMLHTGCVFVAGIHPSRTWISGSFESLRWNACVHRLDLGLYSHLKEFSGNGVRTHVNSKGKILCTGKILRGGSNPRCCITEQWAQHAYQQAVRDPELSFTFPTHEQAEGREQPYKLGVLACLMKIVSDSERFVYI